MKTLTIFLAVGTIFYFALDSSLTSMTQTDCDYGIQAACEEVKK